MNKNKKLHRKEDVNKTPVSCISDRISQLIDSNSQSYLDILHRITALDCEQLSGKERAEVRKLHTVVGDCLRFAWHRVIVTGADFNPELVTLPAGVSKEVRGLIFKSLTAGAAIAKKQLSQDKRVRASTPLSPATSR